MNKIISYREILQISIPLIIASFSYSAIGATDTFFLGRAGDTSYLAAIGLIAPFYLIVSLVSLALARGGQIMIARRLGSGRLEEIGVIARNMFYFELALAGVVFIALNWFGYYFLSTFIDNPKLLALSLDYLEFRVWGVFFGCAGAAFITLYTGVARTKIIIISSIVLATANIVLNYGLIFGHLGLPEMGMKGAGLASAIAEVFALLTFVIFAIRDKTSQAYKLFKRTKIDIAQIKDQMSLSIPIALQSFLSLLGWVVFFGLVENLGEEPLAVSSIMRVIYLFLGAIGWGIGSGTNTIISVLMGQKNYDAVMPTLHRITILSVALSTLAGLLLVIFPSLTIQLITDDASIIAATTPMMPMLFVLLINVAIYTIYFNGIIGMGDIRRVIWITFWGLSFYIFYMNIMIRVLEWNLYWAWSSDIAFGVLTLILSLYYLNSGKWRALRV